MSADFAKKIQAAELPPYVASHTLVTAGFQVLRDIVKDKTFRVPGGTLRNYHISPAVKVPARGKVLVMDKPSIEPINAAALFGKELLLSGMPVFYATMTTLVRETRLNVYNATREPMNDILSKIGEGYLIIIAFDSDSAKVRTADYDEALDHLNSHVGRGGGLVIATERTDVDVPPSFMHTASTFQQIAV